MRVCVLGLWHLGTVTAACLAAGGHEVVGLDFESDKGAFFKGLTLRSYRQVSPSPTF